MQHEEECSDTHLFLQYFKSRDRHQDDQLAVTERLISLTCLENEKNILCQSGC